MSQGCKKYCYGNYTVNISTGNQKMGAIHSVSLPRLVTCPHDVPCKKDCYMHRLSTRPNVKNTYDENYIAYKKSPEWYWFSIIADCKSQRYFRWHVCGDIPDDLYVWGMIHVAKQTPMCKHLCFTKNYQDINTVLEELDGEIPNNLILVFSRWGDYPCDNKYNLPEAWVTLESVPDYAMEKGTICSHSCSECNLYEQGCFYMNRGDIVLLTEGNKEQETLQEQFKRSIGGAL